MKQVPWPRVDCTSIWPLWLLVMMKYETDKPRPVPWPISLVVKNGSKVRLRTLSLMPMPLSSTWISAQGGLSRVRRMIRPGSRSSSRKWMACAAFFSRLSSTCSNSLAVPGTGPSAGSN
ncbi:hypothetical protein D3C73_1114670 [compost metagenome]